MNTREQLELAAKALGLTLNGAYAKYEGGITMFYDHPVHGRPIGWTPGQDQADSDRMACKLKIPTSMTATHAYAASPEGHSYAIAHNNTDEDICRAVREARFAVAVEIGRAK